MTDEVQSSSGQENAQTGNGKKGFPKGVSGNPSGRPKGARNKATILAESLLDGEAEAITRKAIELAKDGNLVALRLCFDRLLPPRRARPITFALPKIATAADLLAAHDSLLEAASKGEITIEDAVKISGLLEAKRRAIDTADLAERLAQIEAKLESKG